MSLGCRYCSRPKNFSAASMASAMFFSPSDALSVSQGISCKKPRQISTAANASTDSLTRGRNLWMIAQKAKPSCQLVWKFSMATPL